MKKRRISSILFVCTANSGRSPMAEYYCKQLAKRMGINLKIDSAGTDYYSVGISEYSLILLREDGINVISHKPKVINRELLNSFDLILCMDNSHIKKISERYPEVKDKLFLLSQFVENKNDEIIDPIGMGFTEYRKVYNKLKYYIEGLMRKISK